MKKIAIIVLGLLVVLIAAVFVVPSIIDWKTRIAAIVKNSTGRELRIDGDLRVSLLPKLRVNGSGIHLSNAPGAAAPEMLSVGGLTLEVGLWPLIGGRYVIDSLIVTNPVVNLEVDKSGKPNWVFPPAEGKVAQAAPQRQASGSGSALDKLRLGDVRIENGQVSYSNAVSGQTILAKSINLSAAMAEIASPLTVKGQMTLNDEPVTADVSVDSLGRLQKGDQAKVKLVVDTKHLKVQFDGTAQEKPVPGLDGAFALNTSSVGGLMAWLQQPLAKGQPDPGALKVDAVFASSGKQVSLKQATIVGTAIKATASGMLDSSGSVPQLSLNVESSAFDLDRYLPPPAKPTAAAAPQAPRQAAPKNPLTLLSDQRFDLAPFRKMDADIKVTIAGIKAMGYDLDRIALNATAKGGVVNANLSELALYGGNVSGTVKLDASHDTLGFGTDMKIAHVTVDKLVLAATGSSPVSGVVSGAINAAGQGVSPRALVENLHGTAAFDLGGVTMKEAARRAISGLKLDVNLPGADQQATLKANLVYNGERLDADVATGPIPKLLAGEKVPAKIALASNLATLRYDGKIQQQPVPGLDGTFDLDIVSVGKLASWLGNPLDAKQPDPGPLKVHAVLTSDGSTLALRDATVTGKALKATAQAQFDGSQSVAVFNAKIDVQQADLNAYLPPSDGKTQQATKQKVAAPQQQPAAGWSSEPFDVAPLAQANGEADVQLASVRYGDLEISRGQIKTTLNNKVLKVSIDKLALAKGTMSGQMAIDASSAVPKVDYQTTVSGVEARPLLKTFADTDRLSGTIEYETSGKGAGRSQKDLVESLNGTGKFKILNGAIHGINLAAALRQAGSLGFSGSQTETTDFAELSGSYTIKDGVLSNSDMKMLAPLLRLNGSGTVPLPPQTIDYTVEANLVATLKGQGGVDSLAGLPIPIRITGPWSNPSYQVDWKTVFNEMAKDPQRLKNLPASLSNAAKGFGLNLPVPGAGGGLNLPQNIPGLPKGLTPPATPVPGGPAPSQQPSTPSLPKDLKGLFKP